MDSSADFREVCKRLAQRLPNTAAVTPRSTSTTELLPCLSLKSHPQFTHEVSQ